MIPFLAVSLIMLVGMIALAVDIGLIAVARTQAQNAADIAALAGARALNGDPAVQYNIANSVTTAKASATNNTILGTGVTTSETSVRTGVYRYLPALLRFEPDAASFTAAASGTPPGGGAWTATEATVAVNSPTYFARIFGINSFNVLTTATAVHRPRDVAIILDFSGSMKFSSNANWPSGGSDGTRSLNPDPVWPKFGHYSRYAGVATTGANPMQRTTNYTVSSGENYAPANLTIETNNGPAMIGSNAAANFVTKSGGSFVPAFFNPQGNGYDPNALPCATPAPDSFQDQADGASPYVGDRWPRIGGFATDNLSGTWAKTVEEFLNNGTTYSSNTHARNANWEDYGYGGYNGAPLNRTFYGYSMGPAYYGKTFWMWPPDPRYGIRDPLTGLPLSNPDPLNPSTAAPTAPTYCVTDTSGRPMGDWRKRFFTYPGTIAPMDDNSRLFDSSGNLRTPGSTTYNVNYPAILRWIKTGPKVFPDNLRSGRVLYYDQIPDDVSGTDLNKVFWKKYIDMVLGIDNATNMFHGRENSAWGTNKVTALSSLNAVQTNRPYMQYRDNVMRPRAHMWFGPYTMLMFITDNHTSGNMASGTVTEAQCWQLKAGIQSAIEDVKKNHPNDWLSLIYFSNLSNFNTPRVKLGQNYTRMKNALWYPFTQLDNLGNPSAEIRPINSSFSYRLDGNVPNARGTTCPDMALKLAYNEFSTASGYNGRRGAAKVVIMETDGVPNTTCGGSLNGGGPYQALYQTASQIGSTSYTDNGDTATINAALNTAEQITKLDTATGRGYSTTRVPARIHVIAFGDLFETNTAMKTTALQFLTNMQIRGKTSPAGATSIEPYKIIVGDYNTRIENLRTAFERIMQSGVQVTLIR
jgi:hypothetical protein